MFENRKKNMLKKNMSEKCFFWSLMNLLGIKWKKKRKKNELRLDVIHKNIFNLVLS